jgi:ATP-binding cassette subfamily C protein
VKHGSKKSFLGKLLDLFSRRDRLIAVALLAMIILSGILEAIGAGLVFPFLAAIADPAAINERRTLRWLNRVLGEPTPTRFLAIAALLVIGFYIAKNVYTGVLTHFQNRFVYRKSIEASDRLLTAYMAKPYIWHLGRNSAQLLRNVNAEVQNVFGNVLVPLLTLLTEGVISVALVAVLLIVAPVPALIVVTAVGGTGYFFYTAVRRRLKLFGLDQQHHAGEMIRWINQAFGGLKESKVLGREPYFAARHHESAARFAQATQFALTTSQLPRLFLETMGVSTVLLIVLVMLSQGTPRDVMLSVLGVFAMASFRLIPSLNRAISSVTRIVYYRSALDVVHMDLHETAVPAFLPESARIDQLDHHFAHEIALHDVTFLYPESTRASVRDLSLKIPRGTAAAFVGPSGAGKTTVVDMIMGLLPPTDGQILVDEVSIHEGIRSWQNQIGYVPQSIYLSDDSIRRNIAFGLPDEKISDLRLWEMLELVQLGDLVRALPGRLDSIVGEHGVKLSGGQRQRIGLARALYSDPAVLVLDEATSALDHETESAITNALESLVGAKTIIIIAHRLSTIDHCDVVFELREGRLASTRVRERHDLRLGS